MTTNLFKFPFLLCLLFFPFHLAANGGGLRILSRKDSAIFSRQSVQLNCSEPACHGPLEPIFCAGPIVWATWQFGMQKECPGNRLRYSPEIVLQNFDNAFDGDSLRRDAFQRFCEENFDNRPYLETARLPEWKEEPKMFARIRDPKMKFFAQQIHKIWPLLSKRFVDDVRRNPSRYPVLAVPNPFIVPSSLFQVYFYWDSYWIIRGLLISDLFDTARGMIDNLSLVLKQIGHIPNSGNVQFSRRSQPPMFTQMLFDFFLATEAHSGNAHGDFVRQQLEWAEKELEWWRGKRTVQMSPLRRQTRYGQLRFADDHPYTLFRYNTKTNCPRPEGFLLDFQFGIDSGREDLEFFWSSTTSAAESGMDFSSRWFSTDDEDEEMAYTRKGIETNNVLPVDLNVFMALNYRAMAQMHAKFGNQEKAKIFEELAENLIRAIDDVFRVQEGPNGRTKGKFDQNDGLWFDYDLAEHRLRKRFYPSDIFPLLLLRKGSASDGEEVEEGDAGNGGNETMKASDGFDAQRRRNCERVLAYLERIGAIGFRGGLPSSMERNSVELWDFPIAWPPTTHLAVLALLRCRNEESTRVARKIADGFITTAYNGLLHTRRGMPPQIWEKYDARFDDGRPGFGADYLEQIGFGWTNGVLLDFIRLFHTDSDDPEAFWRPI